MSTKLMDIKQKFENSQKIREKRVLISNPFREFVIFWRFRRLLRKKQQTCPIFSPARAHGPDFGRGARFLRVHCCKKENKTMLTIHKQHSLFPVLSGIQARQDALIAERNSLYDEIDLTVALRDNGDISDDECDEIRQDILLKQDQLELDIHKLGTLPGDAYLIGYDHRGMLIGGADGELWQAAKQEAQAIAKAHRERKQASLFNLQARARFRA